MSFPLKQRKTKAKEISLPSLRPLESIHHLTEDKPWQFCQNSNQQIASCSACPRQSATVDDKQSDGHSLNYRGKGRASNDPGPILDCTGCLVSSSQRHQGFFFSPPLALSWILLLAEMLIVKAGLSACDQVQAWVSNSQPQQLESMLTLLWRPLYVACHYHLMWTQISCNCNDDWLWDCGLDTMAIPWHS